MALLSNDPNDPAEELAIRALTARFTDAVNRRDPATLGGLFAPDGEWVVPGMGETVGPAAVTAQLETLLSGFDLLVQLVHSGEVRVDGDRASARWYLSEVGRDAQGQGVHFVGVYQDRHVKVGGEWRFARRRFDFLYRGRTEMPGKGYPFPELEGGR